MKKLRLLFALLALVGVNLTTYAQTDVTATYLTNADFSSTDGWTQYVSGGYKDIGNGLIGTYGVRTNEGQAVSTIDETHLATEYCFGFECRWNGNYASYNQTTLELPIGAYTLTFDVENTNPNTSKANYDNLFYVQVGDTKYTDNSTEWMNAGKSNWTTHTITFNITSASTAIISVGYGTGSNNIGSANTPTVHVCHLSMSMTEFIEPTAIALSDVTMIPTATKTLTPIFTPADANHNTAITWESSDESVATVANGVVTAVAAGTATITATTANNVTATCTVTVNEAPLANGDYYLYNEGAGKYVVGANNWGTRASMETSGIKMTATLSDGKYTLSTAPTYTGSYLGADGYVDQGSAQWYLIPTSEGGYIMQCSSNNKYLVWDGTSATTTSMTETLPTDSKGYWTFKSAADRLAVLETATKASPKEATYLIANPDFSRNANLGLWTSTSSNSGEFKVGGGDNINNNLQQWNGYCTVDQNVTNLPNGLYKMTVQGFYRPGGSATTSTAQNVKIYAGDEEGLLMLHTNGAPESEDANNGFTADTGLGSWVPNSQTDASKAFTAGYYVNEVDNILTTDGTIRIGATNTTTLAYQWMVIDNFRLYYYGPTISSTATALPDGSLTAGTWYYFDIPTDGDYNLTVTTLSDVVYTTDAKVLVEDAGDITTNFAKTSELALTAGRYYIKSASAQSFAVTPASYDYAIGEATLSVADGGYTQSSTYTVTFPSAVTNDPNATVAFVDNSTATVNGNTVNLTAVEGGFSLDLGELTENAEFVISIPAGAYGYAAGDTYNEAISLTIHTPAVFDGFYFLRTSAGKYVARGGDYNSRAVVDEFGLPLSVATNASGITQFTYVDNGGKLFLNGSGNAYTDNNTDPNWTFEATEGGYYIVHADGDYDGKKLNVWSGDSKSLFATGTEGTVFVTEPVSEHNTYMEALKDAQAATAAEALGNTTITTKAGLATWLEENYSAVPVEIASVSFTEKWNGDASAEWGDGKDMYTATVNDLPTGLYKLTVNAYYRINGIATAAEGARGNTYLYGNGVKTQLYSLKDFPAETAWDGCNQSDAAGYYPDDVTSGAAATTGDNYLTELYVYVSDGTLTYGIHQPSRFSNGQWFGFQNFTLTRYDAPASITIKAGRQYTAFSYDKALDFTGSDLTAQIVTSTTGETEYVTKVPANTGIIVGLAEPATEATTIQVPVCAEEIPAVTGNLLVAVLEATPIQQTADSKNNYVFGAKKGKEAFYKIPAAGIEVPANNAYLAVPTTTDAKEVIFLGGETTGINNVDAAAETGDLYNLSGVKVKKAQKGVYIQNGKKVIIK